MKALINLIFFINIFNLGIVQAATDCNLVTEISTVECESLLELYHSTNGDNWKRNQGWNETNTPCSWYGITCENNKVIEIELSLNKLIGTLPNFSDLVNLESLYLYQNQLTGNIPYFNTLSNLQELNLRFNQLTGTIPNFNNLVNLEHLTVYANQLTGKIPNFNLPNLEKLWLSSNKLTGIIPKFNNLPNLTILGLSSNYLTGTIPNFDLPNLQTLYISSNQLTGEIPNFNLPNLKELILASNQLTGLPNFDSLPNLELINFQNNQFTSTIPNFIALSKLYTLNLGYNQLTGTIPNFALPNLTFLKLESNQLTGTIPNFNGSPKLEKLNVKSNQLTGPIPTSSDGIVKIQKIDIRDNLFCKQKDFDYSAWSFNYYEAFFDPFIDPLIIDEGLAWEAQLDTFPICETTKDYAFLKFIVFKRYYFIEETANIKIKADFILTDKVDLWVAVEFPSTEFFYLTPSNILSPNPQFFKNNLNTVKYNFPIVSDLTVQKGMAGSYTFYAALVEAGKNPWQDGMQAIKYIDQTSISLVDD